MRDAELNTLELPSHCTKRRMCRDCCWVNGWKSKTNARGDLELQERPHDETNPPPGTPRNNALSWTTFRRIWVTDCSHMRMRPPSRDTCDLCFECKMIVNRTKTILDNNANLPDDDAAADDMQLEEQLIKSANHVKMARAQRGECNEWVRLARMSKQ